MTKDVSNNLFFCLGKVNYKDRCELLKQKGLVVWFTGISGSGKSTIAIEVENELYREGFLTYRLDGDNIRHGLCSDLGFSEDDRNENIRRVSEISALFKDVGILTLVSFISPYRAMRNFAKERIGKDNFIEVFVKADFKTCIERDPKGLYKKALSGELKEFTGISSIYEEPEEPDLVIDTTKLSINESKKIVTNFIRKRL